MVNKLPTTALGRVIGAYVVLVVGTLVALGVLRATAPRLATSEAWGHAVVVAVFAVLLPLRLRSARRGSRSGPRAVGIIGAVLLVVNLVEAALPGVFPAWMRVEMLVIAAMMVCVVVLAPGARRPAGPAAGSAPESPSGVVTPESASESTSR